MGKSQKTYMSIRSKLMAAVAMLLVASFMVVSSTYAWFTLSTAPEVTGIKTTVGSNGSLEIALLDTTDGTTTLATIDSVVGDSLKAVTDRNKTWGNLVDLSDATYGLEKIAFLPARLNASGSEETGYTLASSVLKTPEYGADGRVSALAANIVSGVYEGGVFVTSNKNGVRVLGTASGMTAQQLAYRNSISTFNQKAALAVTKANSSLSVAGTELASIAATHAMVTGDDDTNSYDIQKIKDMLDELKLANGAVGDMLKAYCSIALAIAQKDVDETTYKAASALLETTDLATLMTGKVGDATFEVPANVLAVYNNYYTVNAGILQAAETAYGNVGDDKEHADYEDHIVPILNSGLLDMSKLTISGYTMQEVSAMEGSVLLEVMESRMVQLNEGSGIHANIAQVAGNNLGASIKLDIKDSPIGPLNMDAHMVTTIEKSKFVAWGIDLLPDNAADPEEDDATEGETAKVKNITDYYGYALDFAFRTNAADSDLLLQTAGVNRIYSQGGSPDIQGKGSTMTFESLDPAFTTKDVANLMKAIRLVFVDPTGKVLAIGAVDGANAGADDVTAFTVDGTKVTGEIYLYNYTFVGEGSEDLGALTLGTMMEDESKIMDLERNIATQLSVYAYLDGDIVDNSMVAANAEDSMTGSINLQFSSSAELVPMQYTPLMDQDTTGSESASTSASTSESTSESN